MREFCLGVLMTMLVGGPVLAQPSTGTGITAHTRRSHETPLDRGPFTPEANQAFQGGGIILQGAPGAPPPQPEPTPRGQTPRNMVPPAGTMGR